MAENQAIGHHPDQSFSATAGRLFSGVRPDEEVTAAATEGIIESRACVALAGRMDRVTWLICLLLSLLGLGFASVAQLQVVQWSPWIIGIFFLVLPHGGVDDATPALLRGEGLRRRAGTGFYIWYLGLLGMVLLTWALSANLGLLTFLFFSAYHFGQGDLYWSTIARGPASQWSRRRSARLLYLATRGGLSVFLPFIYHDDHFRMIVERLSEQSGQTISLALAASQYRTELLIALGILALLHIVQIGWSAVFKPAESTPESAAGHSWRPWQPWREVLETGLLVMLMITTPPILSVGVYILCWHAPRHILRLMLLDPAQRRQLASGNLRGAVATFHRHSLALVVVAVSILILISAFWLRYELAPEQLILPAFLFVNAITIPHIVTVTMLDRFQRIWRRGEQ
ncbi:MAG: hypothetical protein RIR86_1650 [Acidobacteriota bacterium]